MALAPNPFLLNAETRPTQSFVLFDGKQTPGRAWPTGAGSPRKWDEQGGYGVSGATLIYMGNGLSEFDVIVDLWDDEKHWAEWNAFAPILEKAPIGRRAKPIEIVHPLVNRAPWKITSIVILDVSQFEQVSPGLFSCRIKCKDYRVAKPALGNPGGIPAPDPTKVTPDPVIDPLTARVDKLGAKRDAQQKAGQL